MLEQIFRATDKLVDDFRPRRVIAIVIILGIFAGLEAYTDYLKLNRLSKSVSIVQQIETIDPNLQDHNIKDLRDSLLRQAKTIIDPSLVNHKGSHLMKFTTGSILWFLLSLTFIPQIKRGNLDVIPGFCLVIFLGFLFGTIGLFIPEIMWPWFNYLVYPIGHFALIVVSTTLWAVIEATK